MKAREIADDAAHDSVSTHSEFAQVIKDLLRDDAGQDLIEYVVLGSFVAIAALAGATLLGTNLNTWYDTLAGWVTSKGVNAINAGS
jgi:Flp pilus assembly pilin Flp